MKVRVWVGFAVFCLVAGSRWLLDAAVPPPLPAMVGMAVRFGLLLGILTILVAIRRVGTWGDWRWIGVWGGVVFGLPEVLIAGADGRVSGLTEALVWTLVPVAVVFTVAQGRAGFGADDGPRKLLGPALAGVAGAALVVPFAMPSSGVGKAWLAGLGLGAVVTGVGVVRLHEVIETTGVLRVGVVVSGAVMGLAAVCAGRGWESLAGVSGRDWGVELGMGLVDLGMVLLGVWLVSEMEPVRFSGRYSLVLGVAILESFFLVGGRGNWVMLVGFMVMVGSAMWLVFAGGDVDSGSSVVD